MCTPPVNSCSSGISAICSGTICSAKMMKNSPSLPRNRTQASAYAAIAASASGMMVAGIVMASELTRYGIRPALAPNAALEQHGLVVVQR